MSSQPSNAKTLFSVVIPSLCDDARSELLKRACDSVRAMAGDLDYSIIVVANGNRVSSNVLEWLASRPDVRTLRLKSGSYPLARRVGAELAESEFLAFLDDDDELLPNTLAPKIAYFREHPDVDALITDGLRVSESGITKIFPPYDPQHTDLVETMIKTGWGACALTLRRKDIDLSAFDAEFRHMEWTLTTLLLARHHKFGFLNAPTYRYYETTPGSLSKKAEHVLAGPEVWRRLSPLYAGTPYEAAVRRRYRTICHIVALECAQRGKLRDAWRFHGESMSVSGGLVFAPFTLKLLFAPLWRLLAKNKSHQTSTSSAA